MITNLAFPAHRLDRLAETLALPYAILIQPDSVALISHSIENVEEPEQLEQATQSSNAPQIC